MANHVSHGALEYPVKGARYSVLIPYLDADGDPTDPTTPDTEISKDAGAFADCAEEASTITGSNGSAYITLSGAEMDCSLAMLCAKVASGPKPTLAVIKPRVLPTIYSGTAQAGASSTITLATDVPAVAGLLLGCIVKTTGGTGGGGTGGANNQARRIVGFTTGRVATVEPAWETTPDNTTTYEIKHTPEALLRYADLRLWNGTAQNDLISGRPDVNTQAMGATVLASINAEVDTALNTAIPGSPVADSVNERLKTLDDNVTATRAGYLDKLNITGNVAGSAEVLAIQNNTRIRIPVPGFLERPDSGSTAYELNIYLYDDAGSMEAPDSTPTIAARNEAGTDRSANLSAVSNVSTGHYKCTYTVASGHAIEQIMFEWSVVEGGTTRKHGASTQIVDTTAVDFTSADRTKLDAIKTKTDNLPADTAAQLATIDSRIDSEVALIFTDTQAIKAAVDTEVAAIKAKTDNLPANPASQTKLDTIYDQMTEDDGGVRRFTTNALEQAPGGAASTPERLVNTTVVSLTSQTVFRLTAGPTNDDALNGQTIVLFDASASNNPSVRKILDYAGSTKEVTIDGGAAFTLVAGDGVMVFVAPAGASAPTEAQVADKVLDELAKQKQEFDRAAGTLKSFKPDGTTVRGTLQLTETGADKVAMVSV